MLDLKIDLVERLSESNEVILEGIIHLYLLLPLEQTQFDFPTNMILNWSLVPSTT